MPSFTKTPLAWKNLTHDWRRLAVAVAGIGFAVLLMFTQVGFQNALFDSQVKMIDDLQGDIFLVSRAKYTLAAEKRFPLELVNQARSASGVSGAYPLYTELTLSRLKSFGRGGPSKAYPIRSIGFRLDDPIFNSDRINSQLERLRLPHAALIDVRSKRDNFPFPTESDAELAKVQAELADRRVVMVGTFDLGTDFAHDGNLAMSAENFAAYFPQRVQFGDPLSVVDVGIIHIDDKTQADAIRDSIDQLLDDRVFVLTRAQFRDQEISFWDKSTPIGIIFTAGKIIGFIVGMVICYQVIYSDIADHMSEFATLRAMGYTTGYFLRLIVMEAVLLSFVGFVPGLIASTALYAVLANSTGLLLQMTPQAILMVLAMTIAMCIASGLLAVRKLLAVDPANLF
ncbi:ABC transporter permease DevC [Lacipirellula sp.]|uniref:ABC transporter permease DevC n=1 Tax=Lacipirellula sp. TaxID=2691419 RepID=UPI003D0B527C